MAQFPLIYYPKPIKECLEILIKSEASIPPAPQRPRREAIQKKRRIPAETRLSKRLAFVQMGMGISIIALVSSILLFKWLVGWATMAFVTSSAYTLVSAWNSRHHFSKGAELEIEEIQQSGQEYSILLSKYNKAMAVRERALKRHISLKELERNKLRAALNGNIMKPQGYSSAPQGSSEAFFKTYLERYFPGRIHQGFRIPIPNYKHPYSADFTYVDKHFNLYVDIEIDEVYYYKKKTPTHCCDDKNEQKRNAHFIRGNWVVMRFAEEQIVHYPERCCKIIATVVAAIAGDEELCNRFKDVPELPAIKHWTTREAKAMARAGFRDKLLKRM